MSTGGGGPKKSGYGPAGFRRWSARHLRRTPRMMWLFFLVTRFFHGVHLQIVNIRSLLPWRRRRSDSPRPSIPRIVVSPSSVRIPRRAQRRGSARRVLRLRRGCRFRRRWHCGVKLQLDPTACHKKNHGEESRLQESQLEGWRPVSGASSSPPQARIHCST